MSKKKLEEATEEFNEILKEWIKEAESMKLENLNAFIDKVMNSYDHDYGTVVHALSICGVAATYAANNEKGSKGGITGFQAGAVGLEFYKKWKSVKSPFKVVIYENMLYPQFEDQYDKIIPKPVFDYLQKQAALNLANEQAVENVVEHWKSIINGKPPFGYKVVQ